MSSKNIVKLDIGGTIFKTSKSTLTKFDGFFKIMLGTDIPLEKDESGCIFIDRDPVHFRLILNFMRDGEVDLPDSVQELKAISREAQFYLLTGLVNLCNAKIPADFPVKLRIIESDDHMLHIIANITDKPVVIIFFYVGPISLCYPPQDFKVDEFLENYKHQFDIYFKPFHTMDSQKSDALSTYRIHDNDLTHSGFLRDLETNIERFYNSPNTTPNEVEIVHSDDSNDGWRSGED